MKACEGVSEARVSIVRRLAFDNERRDAGPARPISTSVRSDARIAGARDSGNFRRNSLDFRVAMSERSGRLVSLAGRNHSRSYCPE